MGCYTWFSVPYIKDKQKIKELAQENLNKSNSYSESSRKMDQYAIDNDLITPIFNLADLEHYDDTWVAYIDVSEWSLLEYNKLNNTNYTLQYDNEIINKLENYGDEPRIGGYPDKIIHSYQEMLDFMKTGFTNEKGKKYDFYYDEDRYDIFMSNIKTFFEKHPDGIITFG